jgi:hypothetical protein
MLFSDTRTYSNDPIDYTSLPVRILPTSIGTVDGCVRGTVSSSVITVDYDNNVSFTECSWKDVDSEPMVTVEFKIKG